MPAPKMLAGLPKPVLFGLYGAVGGLLGALVFGELIWFALKPAQAKTANDPRLAVSAAKDIQVYQSGRNKLGVSVARDGFDGDVTVWLDPLPAGVVANPVVLPAGQREADIELVAAADAATGEKSARVIATAKPGGKDIGAKSDDEVRVATLAPPMPEADIVFVLDVTGSMDAQIRGLQKGIGQFAADLKAAKIDARFGCVCFRDFTDPENDGLPRMQVLKFKGGEFTDHAPTFSAEVGLQKADGGGDISESSFEAISTAAKYQGWRKSASRVLILITDAPPKLDKQGIRANGQGQSVKQTLDDLRDNKIDLLHLVIGNDDPRLRPDRDLNERMRKWYTEIQEGVAGAPTKDGKPDKGKLFDLPTVAKTPTLMTEKLLPDMSQAIAVAAEAKRPETVPVLPKPPEKASIKSLQSSEQAAAGTEGRLIVRSGVWTGAISALVCLMLLGGQHHYLRGTLPSAAVVAAALGGGLFVGVLGGAAGQGLFLAANTESKIVDTIFRVMGWTLLGSLAGVGLALFIPNLKALYGLAGGAVGGAVGAIGFMLVSSALGVLSLPQLLADALGRLAGGLVLGLFIGLMVAIVEAAFRRAWLEVSYGPRETVTVNLGAEPVKVGSDARACTVWARGAAEVELRYFIRDGQVICTDVPSRAEEVVGDGDTREAGNVTVVVRTGSGTADDDDRPRKKKAAPPPRPRAEPRPEPKSAPRPQPLDMDDFDDGLPLPATVVSPPTQSAPVPPKPQSAVPPAPPPRPAAPPPRPATPAAPRPPGAAPAIKSTAKDPDACPGCGRKVSGKPGARYCMVCDMTY